MARPWAETLGDIKYEAPKLEAMDYKALFDTVRFHVERHGIACDVEAGKPATKTTLARAEREMGIRLPFELRELYATMGNGLSFYWSDNNNSSGQPYGGFEVPKLSQLSKWYLAWRKGALYSAEAADRYGFPYTKDPALAKVTAAKMWHWLPVFQFGNGDQVCVDLGDPGSAVVFDLHDWLDGGSGDNGHVLAASWANFLNAWGRVCFQRPKSLYWPDCFQTDGGVAWDGEQFCGPFRIDRLGPTSVEG